MPVNLLAYQAVMVTVLGFQTKYIFDSMDGEVVLGILQDANVVAMTFQRLSRLEEEEKNIVETRKRKFFAEILNAVREFHLQNQATLKRRKQRNDGVQVLIFLFYKSFFIFFLKSKHGKVNSFEEYSYNSDILG